MNGCSDECAHSTDKCVVDHDGDRIIRVLSNVERIRHSVVCQPIAGRIGVKRQCHRTALNQHVDGRCVGASVTVADLIDKRIGAIEVDLGYR